MSSPHGSEDLSATVLEALFTQAPMGLYVFDEQLRIVRYNTARRGVRGLPGDAVLGRRLDEVAEGFHDPELLPLARQVLMGEARVRRRRRGRRPARPPGEARAADRPGAAAPRRARRPVAPPEVPRLDREQLASVRRRVHEEAVRARLLRRRRPRGQRGRTAGPWRARDELAQPTGWDEDGAVR
ncbi:PAS domain-containing protein [Streptomyces canarius]